MANEFQPTFSATLDGIDLDLQFIPDPSGIEAPNLDVSLFTSVGGQPGVPIETILLTDVNGGASTPEIVSAVSSQHPLLTEEAFSNCALAACVETVSLTVAAL